MGKALRPDIERSGGRLPSTVNPSPDMLVAAGFRSEGDCRTPLVRSVHAEIDAADGASPGGVDRRVGLAAKGSRAGPGQERRPDAGILRRPPIPEHAGESPTGNPRATIPVIARVEPDQQNERMHRCIQDRYVSVRPDIDGISFLSAAISSVDATAADQVLTALAATAGPGDPRTRQQRRADALVDVLLGRVSNGCHVTWDTNDDSDERQRRQRRRSRRQRRRCRRRRQRRRPRGQRR